MNDIFKENYLVSKAPTCFPISAVCNCACAFCSNKNNPFDVTTGLFIALDTFQEQLLSTAFTDNVEINISDVLPGRDLSEGEAIIHPQFFQIMDLIRGCYPRNSIFIRTNGIALTSSFLERLLTYRPLHIEISFHCLDPDLWAKIFKTLPSKQKTVLSALSILHANGVPTRLSMVPMPDFVGYQEMEKTIAFMAKYTRDIRFWKPGWTDKTELSVIDMLQYDTVELLDFIKRMQRAHRVYIVHDHIAIINQLSMFHILRDHFLSVPDERLVILTSRAAYSAMKTLLAAAPWILPVKYLLDQVPNGAFGGNIDCAGLLTYKDFDALIDKHGGFTYFVCPPPIFADKIGDDLLGDNVAEFFKRHPDKKITFIQ